MRFNCGAGHELPYRSAARGSRQRKRPRERGFDGGTDTRLKQEVKRAQGGRGYAVHDTTV